MIEGIGEVALDEVAAFDREVEDVGVCDRVAEDLAEGVIKFL